MFKNEWAELIDVDRSLERTAYHEAGHVLGYRLSGIDVDYATLESGNGLLGHVKIREGEGFDLSNRQEVGNRLATCLAGCVAEEIVTGEMLPDIDGDRLKAIALLYTIVNGEYPDGIELLLEHNALTTMEHETLTKSLDAFLDEHGSRLLAIEEVVRQRFLQDRNVLDLIAQALLEKEWLSGDDIDELLLEAFIESCEQGVYSTSEVASILGCSSSTIKRMICSGEITAIKIGSRWQIPQKGFNEMFGVRNLEIDTYPQEKEGE